MFGERPTCPSLIIREMDDHTGASLSFQQSILPGFSDGILEQNVTICDDREESTIGGLSRGNLLLVISTVIPLFIRALFFFPTHEINE